MKKIISLVLAVVMALGVASAAFAVTTYYDIWADEIIDVDGYYVRDWDDGDEEVLVAGDVFYLTLDSDAIDLDLKSDGARPASISDKVKNAIDYDEDEYLWSLGRTKVTATVTKGTSVVSAKAYYDDDEGEWIIEVSPKDVAAVKEHDVKIDLYAVSSYVTDYDDLDNEITYGTFEAKGSINFTMSDTMIIGKKDVQTALKFDGEVDTWGSEGNGYRYVVSHEAFKAGKGEYLKFPYGGYDIEIKNCQITETLNFRADNKSINSIVKKYGEDNTMAFLVFADQNKQPSDLIISAELKEFSTTKNEFAYVYRIVGDDLVLVTDKGAYSDGRTVVTWTTNQLGAFVISAKAIEGAKTTDDTTKDSGKTNPGTGANDVIGLAVAGVVVAMAAGFVAMKKK